MLKYFPFLMFLSTIPLFMYLADGYYQKKFSKGVNHILLFVFIAIITGSSLLVFKFQFIIAIPVILLIGIILFRKKEKQ